MALKKRKTEGKTTSSKRTKGTFIFFIGDEGAILVYLENGEVIRRLFSPAPDAKTTDTFKELLAEYPSATIYMLVDLVDQSYVRHTLPPVTPLGVNKIIQRRLARDFSPEDLKGSISLGREKNGRKDWNFLLIAIAYTGVLKQWCELIQDLPNRFVGIYLAPVESEGIVQMLKKVLNKPDAKNQKAKTKTSLSSFLPAKTVKSPVATTITEWDILVVHNKTGGFRQVVLRNNKLVFTRVAQSPHQEKATILAGNIEQEVKNTIEYLKRLSFTDASTLNIILLVGDDIKPHLSTDGFNATGSHVFTPHEAAELLNTQNSVLSGDRYSDIFLCSAFYKLKKRQLKLIPDYVKKAENLYHVIDGVRAITALATIGLVLGSSYFLYEGVMTNNNLVDIEAESNQLKRRVTEFEEKAATFEVDPFKVDALIKIRDLLDEKTPDYLDIINGIAPFVEEGITVEEFEWVFSGGEIAKAQVTNAGQQRSPAPRTGEQVQDQDMAISVVFELRTLNRTEKELFEAWDVFFDKLQKHFKDYKVDRSSVPGFGNNEDEVSINFEEQQRSATESRNDKKVSVTVTFVKKPQDANDRSGVSPMNSEMGMQP